MRTFKSISLKVLQFNIWHGGEKKDDCLRRLPGIAKLISEHEPDFITLQETRTGINRGGGNPTVILELLYYLKELYNKEYDGWPKAPACNRKLKKEFQCDKYDEEEPSSSGIAILFKKDIGEVLPKSRYSFKLSKWQQDSYGAIVAVALRIVRHKVILVTYYGNYLGQSPNPNYKKNDNIKETEKHKKETEKNIKMTEKVLKWLKKKHGNKTVILSADFNSISHEDSTEEFPDDWPSKQMELEKFIDCYRKHHPEVNMDEDQTVSKGRRIDRIHVKDNTKNVFVKDAKTLKVAKMDTADGYLSDHRAVLVTIEI